VGRQQSVTQCALEKKKTPARVASVPAARVETVLISASESLAEVVVVLAGAYPVAVVPVGRILISERVLETKPPSVLAIRQSGPIPFLVAHSDCLSELVGGILVHLVITTSTVVSIDWRCIRIPPALQSQLILAQSLVIALLESQLRYTALSLELLSPGTFEPLLLIPATPKLGGPLLRERPLLPLPLFDDDLLSSTKIGLTLLLANLRLLVLLTLRSFILLLLLPAKLFLLRESLLLSLSPQLFLLSLLLLGRFLTAPLLLLLNRLLAVPLLLAHYLVALGLLLTGPLLELSALRIVLLSLLVLNLPLLRGLGSRSPLSLLRSLSFGLLLFALLVLLLALILRAGADAGAQQHRRANQRRCDPLFKISSHP
jgi:hypothetical protein